MAFQGLGKTQKNFRVCHSLGAGLRNGRVCRSAATGKKTEQATKADYTPGEAGRGFDTIQFGRIRQIGNRSKMGRVYEDRTGVSRYLNHYNHVLVRHGTKISLPKAGTEKDKQALCK